MNENVKTLIYLGVASVAVIVAVLTAPTPFNRGRVGGEIGKKLFPELVDPSRAQSLEIVRFSEEEQEIERLEIADEGGQWVIASHNDYPANADDAGERIRNAAINLQDLTVLDIATDLTSEHEDYVVVEPEEDQMAEGDQGVGMRITISDGDGGRLARLIVGGVVEGLPEQRFVRIPGQSRVYTVKLDPSKLSTNFKEWIKPDLLEIEQSDISKVVLKDYSVEQQIRSGPRGLSRVPVKTDRLELAVNWNDKDWKWTLDRFREGRGGQLVDTGLLDNEELNTSKLDELKTALDQLEIVDVESKPEGVSATLEAEQAFLDDPKIQQSMLIKGFEAVQAGDGRKEIVSNDGEVVVGDKQGGEYVLRFGRVAGVAAEKDSTKLNRYLLVTARFNRATIDPPELTPEPTTPKEEDTSIEKQETPKTSETPKNSNGNSQKENSDSDGDGAADPQESKQDESKQDEAKKTDKVSAAQSELARIRQENEKKLTEHQEKIDQGEKRAAELNERFGPWYYIISEDVYRKIHLNRFDIIKTKEESSITVDAFRKLESEGLKKETPTPPPSSPPFGAPGGFGAP